MPQIKWTLGRIAIITFLISGIAGTFAYKLMSSQHVQEGGHDRMFFHPYMQTFTMTLGQLLCLLIYYVKKKEYKLELEQGKSPHKFYVFAIPGICDASLSILQYMALNFISGSTFRILSGATILTTLIFSKILLKIVILKRHYVGCGLAFIGLIVVGVSGFIDKASDSSSDTSISLQLLGFLLMLGSLIIAGFQYAYEQLLMQKYTIHPLECVGWQGFFGAFIVVTISVVLTFIPCQFGEDLCVYNEAGDMFFERFDQFFKQVFSSWVLVVLVLVAIMTVSLSNTSGVAITKYYDGLTRCLVVMSKTAGVWIIGLIITFSVEENSDYQLQSKSWKINLVKAAGFVCIIFGTLIYNKLIGAQLWQQSNYESQKMLTENILSSEEQITSRESSN